MKSTQSSHAGPPRLEMVEIRKAFSGVTVLDQVDLSVGPGEVVALLGANGAGKSTLMKILCGLYAADGGGIRMAGTPVTIRTPRDAIRAGIRLIPQEVSVIADMTVAENILIGSLPHRRWLGLPIVSKSWMCVRSLALLKRLGFGHIHPEQRMRDLSLSEQRAVEITRALAGRARLLVMDEPTATLPDAEAEKLYTLIGALKREGVSIIFISHYLDEVFRLTDRIVVLRDGRVAGRFVTSKVSRQRVLDAMLGERTDGLFPAKPERVAHAPVLLNVEGLTLPGWLDDLCFDVRAGEIVGLFGLLGSGVEKVGRAVFGAEPGAYARAIAVDGFVQARSGPAHRIKQGMGFVAAERKTQGIIPELGLGANITAPYLPRYVRHGCVDRAAETRQARRWMETLGVRATGPRQEIRFLSGGNQQKACLARWLAGQARVLVLEEPTQGVDIGARREIYAQIRSMAARGAAVVVVSSDAEEIASLADRVLVLRRGRLTAEWDSPVRAHDLLEAAGSAAVA